MKEKELFERLLLSNLMSKNSSLLFTVEQWELVRRLKSSGITKEQICQAFDDLDKMENDLTKYTNMKLLNESNTINTNLNSSSSSIGFNLNNNNNNEINSTATSTQIVNAYFATMINSSDENKELEDFKKKGDAANQSEISCCVHKYDLKQSQISRMAGVNQAYVSKFLRGEFYEMSENAKILIFKWYLRFLKNPTIFLHAFNVALNPNTVNLEISQKYNNFTLPTNSFLNVTNTSYDVTKRATFRFKPEHLEILERSFIENQYPDQKRREEIARYCNLARDCPDNNNNKERVTEQVITHWFQNKRKSLRKFLQPSKQSQKEATSNNNDDDDNFDYPDFINDQY